MKEEYLKKSYIFPYIYNKLNSLFEFYKYHKDVPRYFLK